MFCSILFRFDDTSSIIVKCARVFDHNVRSKKNRHSHSLVIVKHTHTHTHATHIICHYSFHLLFNKRSFIAIKHWRRAPTMGAIKCTLIVQCWFQRRWRKRRRETFDFWDRSMSTTTMSTTFKTEQTSNGFTLDRISARRLPIYVTMWCRYHANDCDT